ncbi:uncharacterized protein LOC116257030 isoform X2 [Nymphaea colorata]|uniref:uncharacterized protein LOC116257030 isoform X2 n=1 Tax=Nymphaea colorata TaxID=210225 RepID=UPI00129E8837|nr:uncharacterized protein LOC116257030 isoform X2 [Nymphaea colorata]
MEMESSRRPADKTRELGLKRPRLAEQAERNRAGSADGAFIPRFRVSDRERGSGKGRGIVDEEKERDDLGRGAYHQQQELLSQYKAALGELTFNSKPIITNLTIIAGENTHAAKGISATICGNILEVPSEQKLPSLYLLDSIVKNIGGEYVKYFAARLPEVFCKAYRQVDTTIHPSMQHLFRTWKGVFPPPPLRAIEQDLNFPPVNGSSSGVPASRSDSQSQRPGHGIHVNPKYLEARQRLQSGRSRGIETENNGNLLLEGAERPERTSLSESPKPWIEAPAKVASMQRPQRGEHFVESLFGKKPDLGNGDYEFSSDSVSLQGKGITRSSERDIEGDGGDQAWYGGIENSETSATFGKRNGYDMANLPPRGGVNSYDNYRASRSAQTLPQLNSGSTVSSFSGRGISRNWKNSEEEEFMWDDMNSRTIDLGGSDALRKGGWNSNLFEKPSSVQMHKWIQTGSEDLDSNWSQIGNLSRSSRPMEADDDQFPSHRNLEEQVQQSYSQKDGGSRDNREASVDSSSVGQGEAAFVHQTGRVPREKLNQFHTTSRLLNIDTLNPSSTASSDVGQLEGCTVALGGNLHSNVALPSIGRAGVGGQAGPVGPSSFVGPFDGIPGRRQQQPRRPASPSMLTSLHQRPHSPSSVSHRVHTEVQQPYGLPEHHAQATSFLPGKKSSNAVSQSATPRQVQGIKELPYISQHLTQANTSGRSQLHQQLKPLQHSHGASSPAQQGMHLPVVQPEPSQTARQSWQPQAQPQGFGLQATGYSSSGLLKKSCGGLPAESSADRVMAAILKSGLLPAQTALSTDVPKSPTGFSSTNCPEAGQSQLHLNVQPPLPNGPPPVQLSASSHTASLSTSIVGSGPLGALPAVCLPLSGTSQPPLPPGPPPVSSQSSSSGKVAKNPLSSLLSSLVAKGLISTSAPELSKPTPVQVPNQIEDQSDGRAATSNLASTVSPFTPPDGELSVSESSSMPSGRSNASTEIKGRVGIEFKPAIIRRFHLSVINGLFDELPHQCSMCGLRFKFEHNLSKHLNWHASSKLKLEKGKRISRMWYLSWRDWVEGASGPSSVPIHSPEKEMVLLEPMVPADESQSICISCGEPFEDFYCHKRDEWMFKGAIYMTLPTDGSAGKNLQKLIVHANCITESTIDGSAGKNLQKLIVHANCITESTIDSLKAPQTSHMDQASR